LKWSGDITIVRHVSVAFFPLDRQLGLARQGWSKQVEKQVVKLAVRGSYGEAIEVYEELVGLSLAKTTAWERTQERGARLKEARMAAAEAAWAMPTRQEIMPGQVLEPVKKGVTMDGVKVYILGEEWKEVKVGCVFDYETRLEYCRKTQEHKEVVKAENQSYVAYLGESEPLAKLLSAEAERRGYDQAQQRACVGDGAKWIWNVWSLCFPTAQGIVDWPHAVQHLWTAAHLAETMDPARLKRWVKGRKDELWLGHAQRVAANIQALADQHPTQAEALDTQAGYFRRNARRMQYQEFHEEGYPIGSGTVESGCKQLVTMRMKGPGMRWSRPGAEHMLALRTEYLSGRWDEAWQLSLAV
jgi:hypothetical protein